MSTELEEVVNLVKGKARGVVESGEECEPAMFVLIPGGIAIVALGRINKDKFRQAMSGLLQELNAYAYVFINEAWRAMLTKDSLAARRVLRSEISVSELPLDDREEILMVMVAENNKSFYTWSAKIGYTPESKRYLEEWKKSEDIIGGRLVLKEW